jgi:hypothetical protein
MNKLTLGKTLCLGMKGIHSVKRKEDATNLDTGIYNIYITYGRCRVCPPCAPIHPLTDSLEMKSI